MAILFYAIRRFKNVRNLIEKQLKESAAVKIKTAELLPDKIAEAADMILDTYRKGGKVLLIGNGGSAADAQHIAAELVGHLNPKNARRALPAMALTTNTSFLTSMGNDHGYEFVFERKLEAFANPEDLLIAITTSGTSSNILKAVEVARKRGTRVIGLTGKGGGKLKDAADLSIIVPSDDTQRIQEAHITIGHILCDLVEGALIDGTLV